MEARRHGAQRWRGARCYGVAQRSPVWSSSTAWTSVGGHGRQMECGRNRRRESGWVMRRGRAAERGWCWCRRVRPASRSGDADEGGKGVRTDGRSITILTVNVCHMPLFWQTLFVSLFSFHILKGSCDEQHRSVPNYQYVIEFISFSGKQIVHNHKLRLTQGLHCYYISVYSI
jgi:hypothetical protein